MESVEAIIVKVLKDRKENYHTNSAHPIDSAEDKEHLITQLKTAFPDCLIYIETMVTGIHDNKTFIDKRVRKDLKDFVENPRLCVVVDWSAV
jgi:hypothetical protein